MGLTHRLSELEHPQYLQSIPKIFKNEVHDFVVFCLLRSRIVYCLRKRQDTDPCYEAHHDQASCNADDTTGGGCVWCKCSALPSACFTTANAETLPPSIYDCSK